MLVKVQASSFEDVNFMAIKEQREREKEQRRRDILDAARTLLLKDVEYPSLFKERSVSFIKLAIQP